MDSTNQASDISIQPDATHPLAAFRKRLGLTQKELSVELNVARETVARWETGRKIDDDLLPRVAAFTGIPRGILRPDLTKLLEGQPEGTSQ